MKRSSLVFWFLAANLGAQSLPATYQQVLAPALDPQQVAAIENVRFSRDALEFQLSDGFLALTAPVNGHVTAAVFNGHGSLTVTPPTASEAAEVRRFLGEPTVTVQFTQALFRFPGAGWLRTQLAAQARFQANPRGAARQTLEEWRRDLLQRNRYGRAPVDEGPVWLGQRLSSTLDPSAYETVVYDKGGYILYMLREMMLETGTKQPDASFIAMLHDFTQTYSGRAASTADFEAVVNKHMTPEMDLDGNHRMDWFFNEYVYGTGVPRVRFDYTLAPNAKGSLLTMRFHQEPANWKEIMPVYLHVSGKRWLRGKVALRQADETVTVQVPAAVQSVSVNDYDDMLVIVSR
ncbi:MAG TPA: hypothetical protein VE996_14890 [Terriglobales bacterium]|nr:hypothetical protein [Terriglobales bacterium]